MNKGQGKSCIQKSNMTRKHRGEQKDEGRHINRLDKRREEM
jgi:hypothetical protein